MDPSKPSIGPSTRQLCAVHNLRFDATRTSGCVLCRRESQPFVETRSSFPSLLRVMVLLLVLGGMTTAVGYVVIQRLEPSSVVRVATSGAPTEIAWVTAPSTSAKSPATPAKPGAPTKPAPELVGQHIPFTERHPLSSLAEVCRRVGWTEGDPAKEDYVSSQESFELVSKVPSATGAVAPMGLLVWISSAGSGRPHPSILPLLKARNLAFAGLNRAGNDRPVPVRMNLALDAVHEASKRIPIDPERIYIGGFSGGGRSGSKVALLYPEVFAGGVFVAGSDYLRPVPTEGGTYEVGMGRPASADVMERAKGKRYVLITGSGDVRRPPILAIHAAFEADGFRHVKLIDVNGMGHEMASTETMRAAFEFLDNDPF